MSDQWSCPNGHEDPKPTSWPAPIGGLPRCFKCESPLAPSPECQDLLDRFDGNLDRLGWITASAVVSQYIRSEFPLGIQDTWRAFEKLPLAQMAEVVAKLEATDELDAR